MNDERMPINLYTLDFGEHENEPTVEELKKQKQQDCKPWKFLIGVSTAFCLVMVFINVRAPETLAIWVSTIIYLLLVCLVILSVVKIKKIKKVR